MRLSGPIKRRYTDPALWIGDVQALGYRAAELPLDHLAPAEQIEAFLGAARESDIQISEVGAWSNPIDPDPVKARTAVAYCQARLHWAERIGAKCCVNIVGSMNPLKWDAPHFLNFKEETFDKIVRSVREIVDAVKPNRTFYALETMPWIFPSGPGEYMDLLRAIDRPGVAVHLDPVNMINSPRRLYENADFITECFDKLGPHIKSCHAKDIILRETLTVHLDECRPGTGQLDYPTYLRELSKIDPDTPLCLEHLREEEYPAASQYIRESLKLLEL